MESAKYVLTGKKVRENPLLEGLSGGLGGAEEGSAPGLGLGFGQQQQLQLGKLKQVHTANDDDEEDGDEKK